jgi:hypothetical protein
MSLDSLVVNDSVWSILLRFSVNLVVIIILIRFIYYKFSKKEELVFSFFLMGVVIFLFCSILETLKIQIGMAVGLFAIFHIIRFRTINMSGKDMTYFFTVIGVSVINSQANISPAVIGAILINLIIILTAYFLELYLQNKKSKSLQIVYDKLELLNPDLIQDLLKDISGRIGHTIERIKIHKIDLAKGTADIDVFFKEKDPESKKNLELINPNEPGSPTLF